MGEIARGDGKRKNFIIDDVPVVKTIKGYKKQSG